MWTSLLGATAAMLLALHGMVIAPVLYLLWVVLTRSAMALVDGLFWGRAHVSWPFLMFFNQIWGGWLRIYAMFRLDRQGWSRQGVGVTAAGRLNALGSLALHATTLMVFVVLVDAALGFVPDLSRQMLPTLRLVISP
jgi:glycosyltransferase Alg8